MVRITSSSFASHLRLTRILSNQVFICDRYERVFKSVPKLIYSFDLIIFIQTLSYYYSYNACRLESRVLTSLSSAWRQTIFKSLNKLKGEPKPLWERSPGYARTIWVSLDRSRSVQPKYQWLNSIGGNSEEL